MEVERKQFIGDLLLGQEWSTTGAVLDVEKVKKSLIG